MDSLENFLHKNKRPDDEVSRQAPTLLELTRASTGLYIRLTEVAENRYSMQLVRNGGSKPKTKWFSRETDNSWDNLTSSAVRERCRKAMNA